MERLNCGEDFWYRRQVEYFKALHTLQWDAFIKWATRRKDMKKETQEILNAVEELNSNFYENCPVDLTGFMYSTDGFNEKVEFMGIQIWTIDDDRRNFDEVLNKYETFYDCFLRESAIIFSKLRKFYE